MLDLGVDLEVGGASGPADLLGRQVDLRLADLRDRRALLVGQLHRQQPDLRAVGPEDVGEARRDDRPEAVVLERPGRVLAAGPAAEVAAADEDRVGRQVPARLLGPVEEQEVPEPRPRDLFRNCLGMIWSVSTSARFSTLTGAGDGFDRLHALPAPDVDEPALDRRRGGHLGRDEMRARASALAALEVAVRCRGDALAGGGDVRVHAEAHRAAGATPVKPGPPEDLVEALALGLGLDLWEPGTTIA